VWAAFFRGYDEMLCPASPAGWTRAGLPVGVQAVGPHLEDRTTIDFARRLAVECGGFEAPPGYQAVVGREQGKGAVKI